MAQRNGRFGGRTGRLVGARSMTAWGPMQSSTRECGKARFGAELPPLIAVVHAASLIASAPPRRIASFSG